MKSLAIKTTMELNLKVKIPAFQLHTKEETIVWPSATVLPYHLYVVKISALFPRVEICNFYFLFDLILI